MAGAELNSFTGAGFGVCAEHRADNSGMVLVVSYCHAGRRHSWDSCDQSDIPDLTASPSLYRRGEEDGKGWMSREMVFVFPHHP